jgi:glycosyltransferase involved in cell wall biosynthesis
VAERGRHIAVDGRELLGQPTGVGRYLREVLRAWVADPAWPHRLSIVVPAPPPAALTAALGAGVHWVVAPGRSHGTVWEQWHLPRALGRLGADVLLAGAYTAPLRAPCPVVLIVYDVSFFAHPEWFGWREGLRRRWITRRAAHRAARVVTISAFSAGELERWLGLPRASVLLAPPGAPAASAPAAARDPVVLFVGSLFTRRHIPALIAGFARAAAQVPDARLVLVGDNRTVPRIDPGGLADAAGVGDRVDWHAYVDDATLDRLYASARVFAFLSDYEGFAMTPMEALAHGVPPVLLDTEVAREVYGPAALLVQTAPDAIGHALVTLLTDEETRARVLAAGADRLRRQTWARTAATLRQALETAADR